jgi:uncharacterized protein DUF4440
MAVPLETFNMKRTLHRVSPGIRIGLLAAAIFAGAAGGIFAADDEQVVLQSDKALVRAMGSGDRGGADRLFDADFTWITSEGKLQTRAQVLENLPGVANADIEAQARVYGRSAIVRANRGRVQVLRIWVKRPSGWRAFLYQEVTLAVKSEPPVATAESGDCENPCKTIPFQPETEAEKGAIRSWQGVMAAMADNDAETYARLIADEFTATDTHHDRAFTKIDRIAQINKQRQNGMRSVPPALISARMFDFGETVMMIAKEQRPNAKAYYNTRMWVRRDGRWQMLFSFNTRIQ